MNRVESVVQFLKTLVLIYSAAAVRGRSRKHACHHRYRYHYFIITSLCHFLPGIGSTCTTTTVVAFSLILSLKYGRMDYSLYTNVVRYRLCYINKHCLRSNSCLTVPSRVRNIDNEHGRQKLNIDDMYYRHTVGRTWPSSCAVYCRMTHRIKPGFHPNAIACLRALRSIGCSVEAVATMIGCLPTQAIAFGWKPGFRLLIAWLELTEWGRDEWRRDQLKV